MNAIENLRDEMVLIFSDARGQYIPRDFTDLKNVCMEDGSPITDKYLIECFEEDLTSPENRYYWDAWESVLNTVHLFKETEEGKEIYSLYQNGDLWAIPVAKLEALTEEEAEEFWNEMSF